MKTMLHLSPRAIRDSTRLLIKFLGVTDAALTTHPGVQMNAETRGP
jgi:hypothetical protein